MKLRRERRLVVYLGVGKLQIIHVLARRGVTEGERANDQSRDSGEISTPYLHRKKSHTVQRD